MTKQVEFSPKLLTLARKRRGLNKAKLASLLDVSSRSVSAWESGETNPNEETLDRISQVLGFPKVFFAKREVEALNENAVSFRSLTSMTASQKGAAIASGRLALEFSKWIEERFKLPDADVPDLRSMNDPEVAAAALREHWKLGVQPIGSMVSQLEKHGVRVFSLSEQCKEVDAFSLWHGSLPYCFLNTFKSVERSRFDAAHELGHLALHKMYSGSRGTVDARALEQEADAFASAFLMPRSTVRHAVPRNVGVKQLIGLKHQWGVAATALAYRANKVGCISDWHYRSLMIELSRLGYNKSEPEPIACREKSNILTLVFDKLLEEGLSRSDIAREQGLFTSDVDAFLFGLVITALPGEGESTRRFQEPPKLKLVTPPRVPVQSARAKALEELRTKVDYALGRKTAFEYRCTECGEVVDEPEDVGSELTKRCRACSSRSPNEVQRFERMY